MTTDLDSAPPSPAPCVLRMHAHDNVAIVANEGGLPAGTVLPATQLPGECR